MKAIGSKEVGGVSEESNVMNSDECANHFRLFSTASVWWNLTEIAATIETDGGQFRESVGCVP